jgi:hypothetical protein
MAANGLHHAIDENHISRGLILTYRVRVWPPSASTIEP